MTQIDDLQARITRALDRIAQGVESLSLVPPTPEPDIGAGIQDTSAQNGPEAGVSESPETGRSDETATDLGTDLPTEPEAMVSPEPDATISAGPEAAAPDDQATAQDSAAPQADPALVEDLKAQIETAAADMSRLTAELDDEKIANAQLEERLKVLRSRLSEAETAVSAPAPEPDAALQEQIANQRDSLADLDSELQRLRMANDMLLATSEEMRRALEANLGEPSLINKAMLAELEALRASRAVEASESRAVLAALEPLLNGTEAMGETTGEALT